MNQELAADFLTGLAQAVSTMTLYEPGHPARERALDGALDRLMRLQEVDLHPEFTFLGHEIIYAKRPLRSLKRWDWGNRLASKGVQRLEFVDHVIRDDLEVFLEDVYARLSGDVSDTSEVRQTRPTAIRYGSIGIDGARPDSDDAEKIATATLSYSLREEVEAVDWLHQELKDKKDLHLSEAEAIIRSLSVAMHGDQAFLIPLLKLKRFDQYTTTHAMNVSILSMALAEFVGLAPKEIRTFGIAGLLHDLGKVKVPDEILNKPGKLTDSEREVMNSHTDEGARIIIETEENLDLAAVVAYEHHIRLNGEGYPSLRHPRKCHQASNMVHVCDVYDALRTKRPYRDAWDAKRVVEYIGEGAGTEFDADLARAFVQMMGQWEERIAYIEDEDEPLPIGNVPTATIDDAIDIGPTEDDAIDIGPTEDDAIDIGPTEDDAIDIGPTEDEESDSGPGEGE